MEVKYKWSFLVGDEPCTKFHRRTREQVAILEEMQQRETDVEQGEIDEGLGQEIRVSQSE